MRAPDGYAANPFPGAEGTWAITRMGVYFAGDPSSALGYVRRLRVPASRRQGSAGPRRGHSRMAWFYGLPDDHPTAQSYVTGWHSWPRLFGGPEEPSSMQVGQPGPGYKTGFEAIDALLSHLQMAEQVAPAVDHGQEPF